MKLERRAGQHRHLSKYDSDVTFQVIGKEDFQFRLAPLSHSSNGSRHFDRGVCYHS